MTSFTRRGFLTRTAWTAAAAAGLLGEETQASTDQPQELQALIAAERGHVLEAMRQADIPGVAVCLVHEGKPAWLEGFGVTDRPSGRSITPDTLFSIQSTSKNMTTAGVLLAVQSGLLELDTPITAYLPGFKVHSRFEPRPQEKITLRLLLSHRAGFTHEAPVGNNYDPDSKDFESHVRSISQTWLRFPVGERYRYSNLGVDLAGYILQVRSGMPFAQWLRTRLFEPLGMRDTTASPDVYTARMNRAVGHEKGHLTVPLRTPLVASGGVYTSARDMATYSRFHLQRGSLDGKVLLREDLWEQMHGFALGGDYSLGVIRTELRYGDTPIRMMSHQGGGFGFGCLFSYCPQAGLAWVALFNRPASAGYHLGEQLLDAALRARYGARRPRMPVQDLAPIRLLPEQQRARLGNYVGRSFSADIGHRGGTLVMQMGGSVRAVDFTAPDACFTQDADGGALTYRCHPARALEPAHLECMRGEESLDYNEGPHDPAGPDRPRWKAFLGQYRIDQWGVPTQTVTIHRRNGYLYLDHIRLITEHEPGLFFTSDGEAVDFRGATPTWKNIRLQRIA